MYQDTSWLIHYERNSQHYRPDKKGALVLHALEFGGRISYNSNLWSDVMILEDKITTYTNLKYFFPGQADS